jgi:feruloyl esterase
MRASSLCAILAILAVATLCAHAAAGRDACQALNAHTTADVTVVSAELASADTPREHCFVAGIIRPRVGFWLSLPTDWNGRFVMGGGGGYAGQQGRHGNEGRFRDAGYAFVSTDTGHDSAVHPLASFAYDDHAAEIDYAYRAVHLTAVTAKDLIARYYGKPARYNYWNGCSTGGRQGLMSAQRFPEDFDGIVAAAPVLDFTNTQISGVWAARAMRETPVSLAKIKSVGKTVYARCDRLDGLEDGLIDDPRRCDFDVERDMARCERSGDADCLTADEARTFAKIYHGVQSRGAPYFPGQPLGAELGDPLGPPHHVESGWGLWYRRANGATPLLETFGVTFMRYMAFEKDNPSWQIDEFDFDEDPYRMDRVRKILDATNPDLRRFRERGGKMISYHGWSDTALNPMMMVNYYEAVLREDPTATDFYKLYMIPGMWHCAGGRGITSFDPFDALVRWVEQGEAPDALTGHRLDPGGNALMERPVCPYPQRTVYGGGDTNRPSSFACEAR